MRGREPVITLKPLHSLKTKRRMGGLQGMIVNMANDFDAPLPDFREYSSNGK